MSDSWPSRDVLIRLGIMAVLAIAVFVYLVFLVPKGEYTTITMADAWRIDVPSDWSIDNTLEREPLGAGGTARDPAVMATGDEGHALTIFVEFSSIESAEPRWRSTVPADRAPWQIVERDGILTWRSSGSAPGGYLFIAFVEDSDRIGSWVVTCEAPREGDESCRTSIDSIRSILPPGVD